MPFYVNQETGHVPSGVCPLFFSEISLMVSASRVRSTLKLTNYQTFATVDETMILPVLQYPDPRLARVSDEVKEITPDLRELVDNMVETMYARDGIGLAAPQVGEAVRLVVMDVSGPDKREDLRVLINPVLTLSGEDVDSEEGCLSVAGFRSCVQRKELALVRAMSLDGEPFEFEADGMLAICAQHECDHLDGLLFIAPTSRLTRGLRDHKPAHTGR